MNPTRRTFFGSLMGMLAGLPFLGKAKDNGNRLREKIGLCYRNVNDIRPALFIADDDGNIHGYVFPECAEIIRWIPVEERLPECNSEPDMFFHPCGQENWSRPLIVFSGGGSFPGRLVRFPNGEHQWLGGIIDITHWAEMPKGPQA